MYFESRDYLLGLHPWNFAVIRKKLAALSVTPVHAFDYAYAMPSDFIRLARTEDISQIFRMEMVDTGSGRVRAILSNFDELRIAYVSRETNVTMYSPPFVQALAYYTAHQISQRMTGSDSAMQKLEELFNRRLSEAIYVDTVQSPQADSLTPSALLDARVSFNRRGGSHSSFDN